MKAFRRVTVAGVLMALGAWFFWSQAPSASLQSNNKKAGESEASERNANLRRSDNYLVKKFLEPVNPETLPGSILLAAPTVDEDMDDPDLPPGMDRHDRQAGLSSAAWDYIDMRRGQPAVKPMSCGLKLC
jgi:hypothetical protein